MRALSALPAPFNTQGHRVSWRTLWPISDRPTAALMKNLHKEFSAGKDAESALREAAEDPLAKSGVAR